jgi:hypothetical protein
MLALPTREHAYRRISRFSLGSVDIRILWRHRKHYRRRRNVIPQNDVQELYRYRAKVPRRAHLAGQGPMRQPYGANGLVLPK